MCQNPTTTTVAVNDITLALAEGDASGVGHPVTCAGPTVWEQANAQLRNWAPEAPESGYLKVDVAITWVDGTVRKVRYDLERRDATTADLAAVVRGNLLFVVENAGVLKAYSDIDHDIEILDRYDLGRR
jgi:hypothetical protein